jgi:hypothetical protein
MAELEAINPGSKFIPTLTFLSDSIRDTTDQDRRLERTCRKSAHSVTITEDQVLQALRAVKDPHPHKDIADTEHDPGHGHLRESSHSVSY